MLDSLSRCWLWILIMRRSKSLFVLGAIVPLLAGLFCFSTPSKATTFSGLPSSGFLALQDGAAFNYGGLHFSVSGCSLTLNSSAVGQSCSNWTDVTTNSSTAGAVVFNGAEIGKISTGTGGINPLIGVEAYDAAGGNNGGNLFNSLKTKGATYDINFLLTVTLDGSKPAANITSIIETLTGTVPTGKGADLTFVSGGAAGPFSNGVAALSANATSPGPLTTSPNPFAAVTSLNFNVDLRIAASASAAYTFTKGTLQVSPAPEPASVTILLVGLMGLGAARGARRS
jgi:MYXO-CTERM domain-containing protein